VDSNGDSISEYTVIENEPNDPTHLIVECQLKVDAALGQASGQAMLFSYYLDGGSYNGVGPVANHTDLLYLNPKKADDANNCVQTVVDVNRPEYQCGIGGGANQYSTPPIGGASDVEVAAFKGSNIPPGEVAPGAVPGAPGATSVGAYDVIFGFGVHCSVLDWNEYPACAQSDYALLGPDCTAGTGDEGVSGALKSLSRSDLTSIYTDKKFIWEQISEVGSADINPANGQADLTDAYLGISTGSPIGIYRRVAGSGTQACNQAFLTRQECDSSALPFTTSANPQTHEISSSSKILYKEHFLDANNDGLPDDTNACGYQNGGLQGNADGVNFVVGGIAISSLEKQPGPKYGNNWQFVKLDGVDPVQEVNTAVGLYPHFCTNSLQIVNDPSLSITTQAQRDFLGAFFVAAADPSEVVGKAGVLAKQPNTCGNPNDVDGDGDLWKYTATNPVNGQTKQDKMCKFPQQVCDVHK
jgi:hypothetical protein